ncbi:MAG: hypothetical protein IPJ47_18770 [Anaerolineales bacterium]|nr:hypothetical protein [Anaerolineales bacterium]
MQRDSIPNHYIPILLFADGLVSVCFAIFAHTLGMDPTPDWGRSRLFLFLLGMALIITALVLFKQRTSFTSAETTKTVVLFAHLWAFIFIIYTWYITFGTFTEWRASTHYYSLLADAFGKGQLHVDVEPGAALLAAADPYNSEGRPAFDDDIWDLSLYKGKLYLYWGPVPAVLMTPVQLVLKTRLADMYPVFFFLCGLLIFNSLIIVKIWRKFFTDIPAWNIIVSIFVVGLVLPIPWSLSIPDVYEAAIGAGQFFLIGGIYFIILAFENEVKKRYLFLAGLFWACSVGSRAINVIPILFLIALTAFWFWKDQPKNWMTFAAALLTPLAAGALLLGAYNWARFDSPLEFGLRYQITIYNLNRDMPLAFQADYLPYNIGAYILQPFDFITSFPFIRPIGYSAMLQSRGITEPKLYAAGNVTGILAFAPFLVLAILPFLKKRASSPFSAQPLTIYLLGGSFLISFTSLLLYYYGQMRFLVDVISQITLLAIFGYWLILRRSHYKKTMLHFSNFLILVTLIASLLLAVTSESGRMPKLNSALMDKINTFFIEN